MPAGTVTVPLVLVRKPDGTFSQVSVTELVLGLPLPFKLSFVNTLGVVPPVSPLVIGRILRVGEQIANLQPY